MSTKLNQLKKLYELCNQYITITNNTGFETKNLDKIKAIKTITAKAYHHHHHHDDDKVKGRKSGGVKVKRKKQKNEDDLVNIKVRAVLIDQTEKKEISDKTLKLYREELIQQIKETYKGDGEEIDWDIAIDIKIVDKESKIGKNRVAFRIVEPTHPKIASPDGQPFLTGQSDFGGADIYIRKTALIDLEDAADTGTHELGHTMGLHHPDEEIQDRLSAQNLKEIDINLDTDRELIKEPEIGELNIDLGVDKRSFNNNKPLKFDFPKKTNEQVLIEETPEKYHDNIMLSGSNPLQGEEILEEQILEIEEQYNDKKLNIVRKKNHKHGNK